MLHKRPQMDDPKNTLAWKIMSIQAISFLTVLGHALAVFLSLKVSLFPGSDVLLSIVSTCAQIIAGLYGITMAGYTFFCPASMRSSHRMPHWTILSPASSGGLNL